MLRVVATRAPAGVGEGVTIGDGVIGSIVGWLVVGDGVAPALVVAVPVCVDGVGLRGLRKCSRLTTTRTLTSTDDARYRYLSYHTVDLLMGGLTYIHTDRSRRADQSARSNCQAFLARTLYHKWHKRSLRFLLRADSLLDCAYSGTKSPPTDNLRYYYQRMPLPR
jgi:hypothetical protein